MNGAMTIFEILAWAGDALKAADATRVVKQNPRLDAQVLLSYVLGVNSAYLFTHGDEAMKSDAAETFQRLVARRARHEPVAYLTQTKAFFGRDFFVNQHVLIPRPDTEVLVEAALSVIDFQSTIVDIGTGSGAIAISLELETHRPTFATEIDRDTKSVAEHNARNLGSNVVFLEGSLFEPFAVLEPTADHLVITANLPYLTPWQWNDLDADVKDYEPRLALVGGADGLALYDELCNQIRTYLHEASRKGNRIAVNLFIEIDPSQRQTAPALLATHFPEAKIEIIKDMSSRERVVHAILH
ncbi:MAG: peptide chain release factor N(5)-glutamine methyltransferase [Patescibacteria group bacterium]